MNAAHLHVLVNHVPMAFAVMALFTMVVGLIAKSVPIKKLSLGMLVLVGIAAGLAFYSGRTAGATMFGEGSPYEEYVERHEESAETTWIVAIVVGVVGLAGLVLTKRMHEVPSAFMLVSLLALLVSMFFFAKTANLGGQIMHPELRSDALTKFLNPTGG
jgi:hypothetical protein